MFCHKRGYDINTKDWMEVRGAAATRVTGLGGGCTGRQASVVHVHAHEFGDREPSLIVTAIIILFYNIFIKFFL